MKKAVKIGKPERVIGDREDQNAFSTAFTAFLGKKTQEGEAVDVTLALSAFHAGWNAGVDALSKRILK